MRRHADRGVGKPMLGGQLARNQWGKWVAALVVGLVVVGIAPATPFLIAPLWLAEHRTVATAAVHSDVPISVANTEAIAEAISRLEAHAVWSGIDRSTRVLLISKARTYAMLARLVGLSSESQGFALGRTAVISLGFVESMRARWGPEYNGTILDGDLAHIVAHEMAHIALIRRLGRRAAARLPRWKAEGLAEHYSLDPDDVSTASGLARRVRLLLGPNRPQAGVIRGQYVEASLLVNYLAAVQGWTIDQILNGPQDPAELVAAMKAWAARAALTGHNLARPGSDPLCDLLLVPSMGKA